MAFLLVFQDPESAVNYQLLINGSKIGTPVSGNNSSITFGNQTFVGSYTVVATNSSTSCTNNMSGSASISVNALPAVFNVTGGGAFCSGGTGVPVSPQWITNRS